MADADYPFAALQIISFLGLHLRLHGARGAYHGNGDSIHS